MAVIPEDTPGHKGTAYSEHRDGWDRDTIEWLVKDSRDVQVYAILYCFFAPGPTVFRSVDRHRKTRTASVNSQTKALTLSHWDGSEPCVARACGNSATYYVKRDQHGTLTACAFCHNHVHGSSVPLDSTQLACAFTKIRGEHAISLSRQHVPGIGSPRFWEQPVQLRLALLCDLRKEALKEARSNGNGIALAEPVNRGGVWVYEDRKSVV